MNSLCGALNTERNAGKNCNSMGHWLMRILLCCSVYFIFGRQIYSTFSSPSLRLHWNKPLIMTCAARLPCWCHLPHLFNLQRRSHRYTPLPLASQFGRSPSLCCMHRPVTGSIMPCAALSFSQSSWNDVRHAFKPAN